MNNLSSWEVFPNCDALSFIECVRSYGENCKLPCSPHCSQQKCHRFNGTCLTNCTDGFYGEKCDIGND